MNRPESWWSRAVLAAGLLALVALWRLYPQQLPATDPWGYSVNAFKGLSLLASHPTNHPFNQRMGVYLPVTLVYRLLWIDAYTTNLWPLVAGLTIATTTWLALPPPERVVGLVLVLTSVSLVSATTELYPDGIAAALMGLAAHFAIRRRLSRGSVAAPVLFAACAFAAFLAKETAVWLAPFWMWLAAKDALRRDRGALREFHLRALMCGALLGAAYALLCWYVWGSPLARFRSVQDIAGAHLWSLAHRGHEALVRRLTTDAFALYRNEYKWLGLFALVGALRSSVVREWRVYLAATVAGYWLGPTSLHAFDPLPLMPRMTFPCLPGLLVCAAAGVAWLWRRRRTSWLTVPSRIACAAILLFACVLPFVRYEQSWSHIARRETHAMALVHDAVASAPDRSNFLVCSDPRSPDFLAFYWGYRYPPNLVVTTPDRLAEAHPAPDAVVYFYVDSDRSRFLRQAYGAREYDGPIADRRYPVVFHSGAISVYETTGRQLGNPAF